MKRKRFSVEQIVAIVKQAEMGLPVAELVRRVGISEQTFYRWKKQFAGLGLSRNIAYGACLNLMAISLFRAGSAFPVRR